MKHISRLFVIGVALVLVSCIKSEPKNSEADIVKVYFAPEDNVNLLFPPIITNKSVMMIIPQNDGRDLAPMFELTEGARISPSSGTLRDFTTEQTYKVTSEDGRWSKDYIIRAMSNLKLKYDFENFDRNKYDVFYEVIRDGGDNIVEQQYIWSSGNGALGVIMGNKPASDYPTSAVWMEGPSGGMGYSARLVTRSTGLGSFVGMPIAAGNLFIGWFNSGIAMSKPLQATEFGFPINKKPVAFKGWYQYVSGRYDHKGNLAYPEDRPDSCSIYAVLYKSEDGEPLDGSNILTSPNIAATAVFHEPAQTLDGKWAPFANAPGDDRIEFTYRMVVDEADLAAYKYNLAIVFSSSHNGAYFKGAIDSELLIDNVEIIVEE